ncbi:DedD protein [Pseudoalteromonas luteoviolacea B = ATCC 29581]|nr:DedD protein [Pseudoalteromonas luteoviolacea B = ATCC 29581]
MNSTFVNRLVGTSIVVVAAIVFIPSILDGEKIHHEETFPAIPEQPEFTTIDLQSEIDAQVAVAEQPSEPEMSNETALDEDNAAYQAATVEESVVPEQTEISSELLPETNVTPVESNTVEVATLEANSAPTESVKTIEAATVVKSESRNPALEKAAYVIQLGSFSHKSNVEALLKKLNNAGFDAFTRPVKTPNGTLTKVFVGPTTDKANLEAKLPELKKLTKLNARLTEFEPAK